MATRSSISIRNADGSYTGIYCHWDGYLSNNGRTLSQHYTEESKIRELMALGDLSSLGKDIGEKHNFDRCPDDVCNFYGRDRGEDGTQATTRDTLADLMNRISQEYDYLWEGNTWHVRFNRTHGEFITLAEAQRLVEVN